ncbi:MAG: hypothetical protein AAB575_05605 [Patescibacteria group bacterium]
MVNKRPRHQPEYLIIYDDQWEKIIESYFIREKDVSVADEPKDTMNGPIEKEKLQEFVAHIKRTRYPEENRFKIRTVSANSMESVKADLKWVLE